MQGKAKIKKVGNQFLIVRTFKSRSDIGEDVLGSFDTLRIAKNKFKKLRL